MTMTSLERVITVISGGIPDRVFIMGRADQGPMALAAALRGYSQFFLDLGEEKNGPLIERLLDICVEADIRYAHALREAGAHGTSLGELGSDTVSPAMYRRLGVPAQQTLYSA